jgi:hypothetical protein
MFVDPVTLTSVDTAEIITECQRAGQHAINEAAKRELEEISLLARKAQDNNAVLRFGPP